MLRPGLVLSAALVVLTAGIPARAGQPLETETARTPRAGQLQLEATFERQSSSSGRELTAPLALECGLTDRLELLVEPVFYTSIRPRIGPGATGMGDLEITMTGLLRRETPHAPALATALEVKLPTTNDPLIGTGKIDYTGYIIASKRAGRVDAHVNVGYTALGRQAGLPLHNIYNFAAAAEWRKTERFELVGEVIGNTSALPEGGAETDSAITPEIAGAETVGMLGFRVRPGACLTLALGVSYDNNQAWLVRPGVTFRLR